MWLKGGSASPDPVLATLIPLPGRPWPNAPSQPTPGSQHFALSTPTPALSSPFPSSLWTVPLRTVFLPTGKRALPRLEDQSRKLPKSRVVGGEGIGLSQYQLDLTGAGGCVCVCVEGGSRSSSQLKQDQHVTLATPHGQVASLSLSFYIWDGTWLCPPLGHPGLGGTLSPVGESVS